MFVKRNRQPRCEVALGLDLGTTHIKAAVLRKDKDKDSYKLVESAQRAVVRSGAVPSYKDKEFIEGLQGLWSELKSSDRRAFVTISCSSAMVCQTEFPQIPMSEIKNALKINSAKYLRRDFSNYYLDAFFLDDPKDAAKGKSKDAKKKVLVGGAAKEEVDACRDALAAARIKPEVIELVAVSVVNAFNLSHPDRGAEASLVVDIGGRSTTINFVQQGLPLMTRIMHFGGVQLSEYLSQMLGVDVTEAEQQKLAMNESIHELSRTAIAPLAREIRSSIDFFERQHDCRVTRSYACGGSATSAQLLTFLGQSIGVEFESWNPLEAFDTSAFNGEAPTLLTSGPTLAGALGVAASRLT